MRDNRLRGQLQSIESLIDGVIRNPPDDPDMIGHLGKYCCVLAAGFLENALRELLAAYSRAHSRGPVGQFAASRLETLRNPNGERFISITKAFDQNWSAEVEALLSADAGSRRDAIDSIMNTRHLVAHGRNTSIGVARVKDLLRRSVDVVELVEDITLR